MRVGFAGTPEFAARALSAIHESGFTIPLCLTQPDRPKGRGLRTVPSPMKTLAGELGIPVMQPLRLKDPDARQALFDVPLDVLVVAAYGLILPQQVLDWPRYGCLNIHASKLPRWRGAAPIQRAIEAGDAVTGVTIMQMDAGLDTGPMIETADVPIGAEDTAATLHDKLAEAGGMLITDVLARLDRDGALASTPQPDGGATYAAKITPQEARVDWSRSPTAIERQLRAFDPVPGCTAELDGGTLKLWRAAVVTRVSNAVPGTILAAGRDGIDVACGDATSGQALRLLTVQPAGGARMAASAFAAGHPIPQGSRFAPRSG